MKNIIFYSLIGLILSCGPETSGPNPMRFTLMEPGQTGVNFTNQVNETVDRNIGDYDYFYNGGGVAIGDLNNDGLPDLFFTGNDVPNVLYLNQGGLSFKDFSSEAGIQSDRWSTGVTLVDINKDGSLDIYVCNSGPDFRTVPTANQLYINKGDGTFTEAAAEYGIADPSLSTHAVFFDMDNDEDLDLFVLNHGIRNMGNLAPEWLEQVRHLPPEIYRRFCNTLYRNEGNGRFTDISAQAGMLEAGFGLGVAVEDFNEDGLPDLFVANDYFIPDRLYLNLGNGRFRESIRKHFSHTSFFSMGCDAADINNDGRTDLAVLDMTPADHYRNKTLMNSMNVPEFRFLTERMNYIPQYMFNSLYVNHGGGLMSDIGHLSGVAQTDWSWAPLLADFDNDGRKDLFVTNGYKRDLKDNDWRLELYDLLENSDFSDSLYFEHLQKASVQPIANKIYQNQNGYQFSDRENDWGTDQASFSNGAAYGDLDLDGDLDLVVNNFDQPAFIYRNEVGGNYIRFSGADMEGAELEIYYPGGMQSGRFQTGRGYQSSVEPVVHFGLIGIGNVDSLVVRQGNRRMVKTGLSINRVHKLVWEDTEPIPAPARGPVGDFWDISELALRPPFQHRENEFDDFAREILLPHRQSRLGPALAVGDVNGDGLDDFFVGGAKDQENYLYVQNSKGYFQPVSVSVFSRHSSREAVNAQLFDVDGDEDLDLYVAYGGGGDLAGQLELLQDVLYLNEGGGVWSVGGEYATGSTAALATEDWDLDGDLDLFVGGRTEPGEYPRAPRSYFLENQDGELVIQEERSPGMVTSALWMDWNGDSKEDLVLAGEWMPLTVFLQGDDFLSEKIELEGSHGWWYSLSCGDIDQDGDLDLVAGNLGLNNKFHPSPEKPLWVYANDFDDNGSLDIVLSKSYRNIQVPVRGRQCSSQQMPFLQEKFPTYDAFASADIFEVYGAEKIEEALQLKAETFSSQIWLNEGLGQFRPMDLPLEAQFAPIMGMIIRDYDQDGNFDILLAGNQVATEVETTPYDAGKGLFLRGNGDGTFSTDLSYEKSGLFLDGDVKWIKEILVSGDGIPGALVGKNDGRLRLLMWGE